MLLFHRLKFSNIGVIIFKVLVYVFMLFSKGNYMFAVEQVNHDCGNNTLESYFQFLFAFFFPLQEIKYSHYRNNHNPDYEIVEW